MAVSCKMKSLLASSTIEIWVLPPHTIDSDCTFPHIRYPICNLPVQPTFPAQPSGKYKLDFSHTTSWHSMTYQRAADSCHFSFSFLCGHFQYVRLEWFARLIWLWFQGPIIDHWPSHWYRRITRNYFCFVLGLYAERSPPSCQNFEMIGAAEWV